MPDSLSNNAPTLIIEWDASKLGITGKEVSKHLYDTEPRLILAGARGSRPHTLASSVSVMPYMMTPGDDKIAAERLFAVLSKPPKVEAAPPLSDSPAIVAGQWDVIIEYARGTARHALVFEQKTGALTGTHHGEIVAGDLRGGVVGNEVHFVANHRIEGTSLHFSFRGHVHGDNMTGTVDLGEYGDAKFTSQRHQYKPQQDLAKLIKHTQGGKQS
jgi:hypothetical protein